MPDVQYARSGKVSIAYQVVGDGPVDLLLVPGFISNLEVIWEWKPAVWFFRQLAEFSRLILLDKRGTGLSDRVPDRDLPTLEQRMDDVRAVLDAIGSERAVLMGVSEGGPMSILFAATYPERTAGLILNGSMAKGRWAPDYPWAPTQAVLDAYFETLARNWGSDRPLGMLARTINLDDPRDRWWVRYCRLSASPSAAVALERMNAEIDVPHILPAVKVSSLVLHYTRDTVVRVEEGRYIAAHIRSARLIELPGEGHSFMSGDEKRFVAEIATFLTNVDSDSPVDSVLVTALVVAFTPGTRVALTTVLAHEIERYRGRHVTFGRDSFMFTFDGPARAIRCAHAIITIARGTDATLRCGLHVGEVNLHEEQITGAPLRIAAELASIAYAGEIYITGTVRDLVAGSGIRVEERASLIHDEFPEPIRVFGVDLTSL